jgi:hypothetical protein
MNDVNHDRCACGEVVWEAGKGWPYDHQRSQCLIGKTWVQRSTFEYPKLELVKAYVAEKTLGEKLVGDLEHSARVVGELRGSLERALEDAAEWKAVATSQARILAREVPRG